MDRLYAPWRTEYIVNNSKKIDGCVFCHIVNNNSLEDDDELGVLHRDEEFFIVMNKYPYSPGHFMIIPNIHTANLEDLDPLVFAKMSQYAQKGVKLLKDILNAQGVNIGMNLGKAGGAGIEEHIHLHLVPRWGGDTNFITTIGDTRIYSSDAQKVYKKLKNVAADYFR
ncbi:MAG: HIT domain-containing protein [Campylobacterota bacterium]|nr:HIT domain-containing protein [Campylobacterota bacterium]